MFDPVSEPFFRLDIPNLSHTLNVLSFTGTEAISRPFAFELEVVSESSDLNLQSLMYRPAWLSFAGTKTGINGQIHGAGHSRHGPNLAHYRLSLGPRLACLAQRFNQRIFQCLSVPQVIARVLKEHGIRADAHRFELSGTYLERMYCAQHHESDLQFIQRLCDEEGIHYHFQHSKLRHVLVFGDSQGGFRRGPTCFFQAEPKRHGVSQFTVSTASGEQESSRVLERAEGESTSPYLGSGLLLPLSGHPQKDWNHLWLLTEVQHRGHQPQVFDELLAAGGSPRLPYSNHFQATPWEVGFRPSPVQPRSRMFGVQRAQVVGPIFDQVYCDPLGRISVQFDWGRQGDGAHYASCWVPVSSALVGEDDDDSGLPRVGMEVVVSFVHGDPDQPVVTACLQRQDSVLAVSAATAESGFEPATDEGPLPRANALRIRLDPRTFVSAGQRVELSGGITLTFENDSELIFSVGDSSVHLGADSLKLYSEQIAFNAAPAPLSAVDPHRDASEVDETDQQARANELLELLQASHPLVLLCQLPSGGSLAHCQKVPCACRAMTRLDEGGAQ